MTMKFHINELTKQAKFQEHSRIKDSVEKDSVERISLLLNFC